VEVLASRCESDCRQGARTRVRPNSIVCRELTTVLRPERLAKPATPQIQSWKCVTDGCEQFLVVHPPNGATIWGSIVRTPELVALMARLAIGRTYVRLHSRRREGPVSQFHVNQIETRIRDLYQADHWVAGLDDVNNLSRLLALHAVHRILGGPEPRQYEVEITDGADDRGIDAVGVDEAAKLVVLVQSKWRQDGTGSMALADMLKFVDGVRSLIGMQAGAEPVNASQEMRNAVRDLLKQPGGRICLVTATTASEPLAPAVVQPVVDLLAQLNDLDGTDPLARHEHLGQAEFFNALAEVPTSAVDLDVQLMDWGKTAEPVKMYYGRVGAADIAKWFQDHGTALFTENIRVVIPRSDINEGILETIRAEPGRLGYFNNGITVLAQSIEIGAAGVLNRDVGYLKLTGASIVNGAQTVSTLGRALGTEIQDNLTSAFVVVRCIEVPANDVDLGRRITRFANTQNEVSTQDFASLDSEQHRLAKELRVLGYEYLLRSGEVPTLPSQSVIDVRQAAVALACARPTVAEAVIAKREVSRLFSDQKTYATLFNATTHPLRLARAVQVVERVDAVLDAVEQASDGVKAGVAVHGRRAIAHVILRAAGDALLTNPEADFEGFLSEVDAKITTCLDSLVAEFPDSSYPGNLFKNLTRTSAVLMAAGY
jgi:hypothetical protein